MLKKNNISCYNCDEVISYKQEAWSKNDGEPDCPVFCTPECLCGNYVITFKFMSEGNTCIEDVMIRRDAIIDLARFKPDAVNEYFSVMKEALNYSDILRNKHKYFKAFGKEAYKDE